MKIAAWNVNSVKSRLGHLLQWIAEDPADVILLQELKCEAHSFPYLEIEQAGYHIILAGQKSYNGVAILSKIPVKNHHSGLREFDDDAARYIEAELENGVTVASVYIPNGQSPDSEKYQYKMRFYNALSLHLHHLLQNEAPFVLGGDFNVCHEDMDTYDPAYLKGRIHFTLPERHALNALINLGFADTFRMLHPGRRAFSWWDYREGSWAQDKGLRIDYILTSPQATDRLVAADINRTPRGWDKPSDHTPVWIELQA